MSVKLYIASVSFLIGGAVALLVSSTSHAEWSLMVIVSAVLVIAMLTIGTEIFYFSKFGELYLPLEL